MKSAIACLLISGPIEPLHSISDIDANTLDIVGYDLRQSYIGLFVGDSADVVCEIDVFPVQ